MKKMCLCLVMSGAVTGMIIGVASSFVTAAMIKEKLSLGDVMRCKAKSALSGLTK